MLLATCSTDTERSSLQQNKKMNKGDIVKFVEMQIGDYFSDDARQKFQKIPPFKLSLPDYPPTIFNAFHFQSNAPVSLHADSEWNFITHSELTNERLKLLDPTIEEMELDHKIDFFNNYLDILESALVDEAENSSDHYYDDKPFSIQEVDEFFSLLRSSFFVSLFSFLETQLNNECRKSQAADCAIKVSLDDIHGSGINRAKTYLSKVLNSSYQFYNNTLWEEIQWYNKIRNCIVHNNGIISDKTLKQYIMDRGDLQYMQFFGKNYVILSENFCRRSISIIGDFLKLLLYHRYADKIVGANEEINDTTSMMSP